MARGATTASRRPISTTCNGHSDSERGYHYHATAEYPYIIGAYRGVVEASNIDRPPGDGPPGGPAVVARLVVARPGDVAVPRHWPASRWSWRSASVWSATWTPATRRPTRWSSAGRSARLSAVADLIGSFR